MSKNERMVGISRRTLVKSTAIGSLALAAGGFSLPFTLRSAAAAVQQASEKVVWGACSVNCGSRCALRLHVKDNEVIWVETDNTGNDEYGNHQVRACLRGRSIRRRINHPDRLNYPMKRVGKRGEGKFERISWDEALDTIASSLKKTVEQYGNEAVYIQYSSGIVGGNMTRSSPSASAVKRLMNCYGGSLNQYGSYSTAQISCAMPYTYGSNDGNSTTDIENSKLVVMFGNNPAETRMSGGGITYLLEKAREKSNAKMIVIDPRYTDTAAGREDEWLPIRPGTDAALVAGIAWVLINENLVDQPFLDKYCVGYDEKTLPADAPKNGHYKAYILGEGDDKTAKTPQWASQITGIPEDRIIKLAREIGTAKPAYICQGWGPQRQANGELTARAIAMLPILTGNVGISGGNSGARESTYTITIERLPVLDNPVKTSISCFSWTDAIDHGPQMTAIRDGVRGKDKLDVPIKFIWNYAGNTLVNQHSDINKTHEILQDESKCEMIVVIENFMTSSAKYADILLPDLMTVEQEDIIPNDYAGNMGYLIFLQPVTSEKFERKPIYWILSEVAKRLGPDVYQKFTEGRTQEQWLQHLYAKMLAKDPALPSYDEPAAGREDEWLPIRPGTDGALACAIAWVLITENMVDQPFLDKYCVGYDEKTLPANAPRNAHYKAYILGEGPDGIAKTPEWAAKITSIPAEKIIQLAREIGSAKPAYICQGWGPQRHSNGEQTSRAIAMLSVLTGNVGINGGNSGVREGSWDLGVEWFPMLENPVKTQISVFTWTDAIDHGTEMTATRDGVRGKEKLDVPIKFLWCYASNTLINQHGDINHTHEVFQDDSKCEMIVGIDHFMTASAKYCDILLPDLMPTEQEDLISHESAGNMGYVILAQPATSAKFERKPIYWMLSEVAKRLGPDVYQTFTEGRSQHEWIKYLHAKTKERNPEMPDYEEMKTTGIFKKKCPEEHYVAFRAFREDPQANPLKTPSGKIEIYSERLAKIADTWELKKDEIIHPLPAYTPGFDGWDDPLRKTYPLQLTGFHYKARTHSSYGNIDVLQQACPQEVWINPIDAQARGIRHGDTVRVFNNNGEMLIAAKVTPRILPGVTAIGQGAWLKADMFGDRVDHGGSINILTSHRPSPLAKGNPSHSNLVQIEKV
ncbi:molybdopterin-dependent oxidoreductase [Escherichia coli O28ac]|nr:anaerobic dimethyl sulfoxide reductase chain A [Escherichia coli 53638]EFG9539880.1 molybdopterin-dependent oxidoreductase [Escherichia coli]EHD3366357.1 molybdopterin-dependent oxidoreductase [Escherichia coli O28ac]EJF4019685.1 molybdopterin-dependent oxidoreductase [Shigella dysenteriae]QGU65302.1 dimethylsulfoxide reductase subunit A [Shigella boydii]